MAHWNGSDHERWQFALGLDVRDAAGAPVGAVAAILPAHLVVEDGLVRPSACVVPYEIVQSFDSTVIRLSVTRDALTALPRSSG